MPRCSTADRSAAVGLAVPMSKPRYTWRESAPMIIPPCLAASARAIADLPAAVGPQMTRMLASAKPALELVPGELHDRRAPVDVVGRQGRSAKGDEERAHLAKRENVSRLDGGLAGDGRGEPLVTRRGGRQAIPGQRIERIPQASLGVEPGMRHRHRMHDQCVAAELVDLESEAFHEVAIRLECLAFGRPEVQRERKE